MPDIHYVRKKAQIDLSVAHTNYKTDASMTGSHAGAPQGREINFLGA